MGLLNFKSPGAVATGIIMLVVAILVMVTVLPQLITALINISTIENLAFANFFASGGVVLLLLSVGILIAIFKILGFGSGKMK